MIGFYAAGAMGQGGAGHLVEVVGSYVLPADTVVPVQMPAVVNAGDRLIVLFSIVGSSGSWTLSGWSQFFTGVGGASVITARGHTKIATGTEGGTIVNFTMSSSRIVAAACIRIPAGLHDPAQLPESSGVNQNNSSSQNPPNLTPSWGTANNIWIPVSHAIDAYAVTGYPYPSGNFNQRTEPGVSSRAQIATCYTQQSAASLDPGAFTYANNVTGYAVTIAVKPL